MLYIGMYLVAIIAANLITAHFGPAASVFNAFALIGLDLTARDKLHDAWNGNGLVWKMGALIATGSALSWLFNRNAGMIAIASFSAFASAAIVDTLIYQVLHKRSFMVKVNGSNLFSAAVDSAVFPTLAFGGLMPLVTLGQFVAKVGGGAIWSVVLARHD